MPSYRIHISAVLAMTAGVALLVLGHVEWGFVLFALGGVVAVVALRAAAREVRNDPRLSRDDDADEADLADEDDAGSTRPPGE